MSSRSNYTPGDVANQGLGGNNNQGIIVVRHKRTGKKYIEKRVEHLHITYGHFQREVRMMRQAWHHANIVSLINHDTDFTRLGYGSIFMQRGELGGLDALIARYRHRRKFLPDEGFTWKVLWDVSLGLAYLNTGQDAVTVRHAAMAGRTVTRKTGWQPIYHRDIKPSNIFTTWHGPRGLDDTPYPTMLIGDFGCAITDTDKPAPNILAPDDIAFAAPEDPAWSDSTDVYSLALVIACVGWMKHVPPSVAHLLSYDWASPTLHTVLRRMLKTRYQERLTPGELPKYVWRGYQSWRMGRRDAGAPLLSWALPIRN